MKNIKELLIDATKYPAAIEARLPEAFPKISVTLVDIAGKIPVVPDFPIDIPALPAPPAIPEFPAFPGGNAAGLRRYVTGVEVRDAAPAPGPALSTARSRLVFE